MMKLMATKASMLRLGIIVLAVAVVAYTVCCSNQQQKSKAISLEHPSLQLSLDSLRESQRLLLQDETSEQDLIEKIAVKLQPAQLQVIEEDVDDDDDDNEHNHMKERTTVPKLKPHQFLHLHHMKTGGTSMDHMMRCAMDRLRGNRGGGSKSKVNGKETAHKASEETTPTTTTAAASQFYEVPYFSIHECSRTRFSKCLGDPQDSCRPQMKDAAVMSYCSALKNLDEFGWNEWGGGLEQVESNRRMEDNDDDVDDDEDDDDNYDDTAADSENLIEANNNDVDHSTEETISLKDESSSSKSSSSERIRAFTVLRHPVDRVWSMFRFQTKNCFKCMPLKDIYNHLIDANTNSITRDDGTTHNFDELCLNQLRNHEVANLLTSTDWPEHPEDAETQDAMVAEAISNMKNYFTVIGLTEELVETRRILGKVFPWMNETLDGYEETCPLQHDNSSPSNNRCVKNKAGQQTLHWDLPKYPDDETRQAIVSHNAMDMKLYEAAVEYFELQRRALEREEQET